MFRQFMTNLLPMFVLQHTFDAPMEANAIGGGLRDHRAIGQIKRTLERRLEKAGCGDTRVNDPFDGNNGGDIIFPFGSGEGGLRWIDADMTRLMAIALVVVDGFKRRGWRRFVAQGNDPREQRWLVFLQLDDEMRIGLRCSFERFFWQ